MSAQQCSTLPRQHHNIEVVSTKWCHQNKRKHLSQRWLAVVDDSSVCVQKQMRTIAKTTKFGSRLIGFCEQEQSTKLHWIQLLLLLLLATSKSHVQKVLTSKLQWINDEWTTRENTRLFPRENFMSSCSQSKLAIHATISTNNKHSRIVIIIHYSITFTWQ